MKKKYIKPNCKVYEIDQKSHLCEVSKVRNSGNPESVSQKSMKEQKDYNLWNKER